MVSPMIVLGEMYVNDWQHLTKTDVDIQPTLGTSPVRVQFVSLGKAFARKDG